jgi:hypothetical protein
MRRLSVLFTAALCVLGFGGAAALASEHVPGSEGGPRVALLDAAGDVPDGAEVENEDTTAGADDQQTCIDTTTATTEVDDQTVTEIESENEDCQATDPSTTTRTSNEGEGSVNSWDGGGSDNSGPGSTSSGDGGGGSNSGPGGGSDG